MLMVSVLVVSMLMVGVLVVGVLMVGVGGGGRRSGCRELTTLWVARLDDGVELKVTDPKEQQGDVDEEETEDKERWDRVDGGRRRASC